MENLISISTLNDFIFCPYSIYLHNTYYAVEQEQFHEKPQVAGKQAHAAIDTGAYSTHSNNITGIDVYSEKYGLIGKIDLYKLKEQHLIERKRVIKTIYDGYKLQLYAQYFCMVEMEYPIQKLSFYASSSNKHFNLPLPNIAITQWFESCLNNYRSFNPQHLLSNINTTKCQYCVYRHLCDQTSYQDNNE